MSISNDVFRFDKTAWHVFTGLLLLADRNGEWKGGRIQLGSQMEMNAITAWKAAQRLQKVGMISISSNSRFSTFRICKYKEFQSDGISRVSAGEHLGNNAVTAEEHSNKNKEVRIKNNTNVELQEQLRRIHSKACDLFGKNENQYKLSEERKKKYRARLKDIGEERMIAALTAVSDSPFHRGDNDRGWEADPDWVMRSYAKTEEWANKAEGSSNSNIDLSKIEIGA